MTFEDLVQARPTCHAGACHHWTMAYRDKKYEMPYWRKELVGQALEEWLEMTHKGTYIDVGCGRGESLEIAEEMGIEAKGIEIVPTLVSRQVSYAPWGFQDSAAVYTEQMRAKYVTCMDVLQFVHEEKVQKFIRRLMNLTTWRALVWISSDPGEDQGRVMTWQDTEWWFKMIAWEADERYKMPFLWTRIMHPHGLLMILEKPVGQCREAFPSMFGANASRAEEEIPSEAAEAGGD